MSIVRPRADILTASSEGPFIAITGHSLVRRVALGAPGADRLGAGLHLSRLGVAFSLT